MKKTDFQKKAAALCAALVLLPALLAGCGSAEASGEGDAAPMDLAIVYGCVAGSPCDAAPAAGLLETAARAGGSLTIIVPDGDPQPQVYQLEPIAGNLPAAKKQRIISDRVDEIGAILSTARAAAPQSDYLSAASLAGRSLLAGSNERKVLLFLGSGLNTCAPMDLSLSGVAGVNVDTTVSNLSAAQALPRLDGVAVCAYFVGDVAEGGTQPPLSPAEQMKLQSLWQAIFTQGGAASVEFSTALPTAAVSAEGLPEVSAVPVLADASAIAQGGAVVVEDSTAALFAPDSAELIDPASARSTAKTLAQQILSDGVGGLLVGCTSSAGTEAGCAALGLERACVIKELLVAEGVADSSIRCIGAGFLSDFYIPDRDADGALIEEKAAANRATLFIPASSPLYDSILSDPDFGKFALEDKGN